MYVNDCKYKRGSKTYRRVLIVEGYRENGKNKQRIIANISRLSDIEIESVKIALKNKNNIPFLKQLAEGKCVNGKIFGCVFVIWNVIKTLKIDKILSPLKDISKYILWLIIARLIDQGSRLSAVRLAQIHYGCELLKIEELDEDCLYNAMDKLYQNKDIIEINNFKQWKEDHPENKGNQLFLYDVTSSYLEGEKNELADWGYNRDKKNGKKQIVYGVLTDSDGDPLGIEVFRGNTNDTKTVASQIEKIKEKFGCRYVTVVGDKGMIKTTQIEMLHLESFNFITSITKAQIETLLERNIIQMELFEENLCEVEMEGENIRYILRRNPYRVEEIKKNRELKINSIIKKLDSSNNFLKEHKKAKADTQIKILNRYIEKIRIANIVSIEMVNERELKIKINYEQLEEIGKLDGCYCLKTDLPASAGNKELIHERYKALAEVEKLFRIGKSELNARPVFVRKKERTIAHFLIVMFAYKIERYLRNAWRDLDITVPEGIEMLSSISGIILNIGKEKIIKVPEPNEICKELLDKILISLPKTLQDVRVHVVTNRKLPERRK